MTMVLKGFIINATSASKEGGRIRTPFKKGKKRKAKDSLQNLGKKLAFQEK
jgi:hypothetical protein